MRTIKRTVENIERAKALKEQGYTGRKAAEVLGISEATFRLWVDEEKYSRHKRAVVDWGRKNPEKIASYKAKAGPLTPEQMEARNARQRERYADNPKYREMFRRLAEKYRNSAQGRLAQRIRTMTLGYADRTSPTHQAFMRAVTGLDRGQFMEMFKADGVFDHITPICAFDLTNPEHLVRCCYVANLQIISRQENERKGDSGRDVDVMALPWIETPDALVQAQTFISRQLAKLERDGDSELASEPVAA